MHYETSCVYIQFILIYILEAMKLKDAFSLEENLDKLDSILKSRDITLLAKICLVKAMVFPVVMYRCKGWTIQKAEC